MNTRLLGTICVVGSLLGAASAAFLLLVPAQVPTSRWSYPFDSTTFTLVQIFFAVQHVTLLAGVVGMLRLLRGSRLARAGLFTAAVGLVGFVLIELVAIAGTGVSAESDTATALNNAYGIPMTLTGIGLVVGGIGVARSRALDGWARWIALVTGVYVFVPLFPAVFAPFVVGRLAIGVWLLLFALVGLAVRRASEAPSLGLALDRARVA